MAVGGPPENPLFGGLNPRPFVKTRLRTYEPLHHSFDTPDPSIAFFFMEVESVLATFKVPGVIDSRGALDEALLSLLEALDTADADVVSLLTSLVQSSNGILEAVITSREETFRFGSTYERVCSAHFLIQETTTGSRSAVGFLKHFKSLPLLQTLFFRDALNVLAFSLSACLRGSRWTGWSWKRTTPSQHHWKHRNPPSQSLLTPKRRSPLQNLNPSRSNGSNALSL